MDWDGMVKSDCYPVSGVGTVCITEEQRHVHMTTEAIAVALVAPFMFYIAWQKSLPAWARAVSFGIGVGTVIVDGGLLLKYLSKDASAG